MADEPKYVEGDPNQPLPRGELTEALQLIARSFDRVVTKDELRRLEARLTVTFALKKDLSDTEARLGERLDTKTESILRRLDATAATVNRDVAATVRELLASLMSEQQRQSRRIARIEEKIRLSPPR